MDETKLLLLRKKLKELKTYKGQGTQLISLYLPRDVDRSSVTKQLTDELSQSSNIKSQQTRKNVQAALRRIIGYLKQIDFSIPETGMVVFSGNVSTNPAKDNVVLLQVVPPKPLATKLYWCDSEFHTAPLEDMAESDDVYGLMVIDKREATISVLHGKSYTIVGHETSGVPGKARAGGQSAARFERLREKAAESFYKRVGERVNATYVDMDKLKGIVIGGPGNTKDFFIETGDLDHRVKQKILGTVDTCYTDDSGIREVLEKGAGLLKEVGIIKERNLINKFIEAVAKNGLATYGFNEVVEAINFRKVELVLVSAGVEWTIAKFKCNQCGKIRPKAVKNRSAFSEIESQQFKCPECESDLELVEEVDFFDFFLDLVEPTGAKVELVSIETEEGNQFFESFGGIGAMLRYK